MRVYKIFKKIFVVTIFLILLLSSIGISVSTEENKECNLCSKSNNDIFRPLCIFYAYMIYYYGLAADSLDSYPIIQNIIEAIVDGYEMFYYDVLQCE